MDICQRCHSRRLLEVQRDCMGDSYECKYSIQDRVKRKSFRPLEKDFGIGDRHINFIFCLDCGQIQEIFPRPLTEFETLRTHRSEAHVS